MRVKTLEINFVEKFVLELDDALRRCGKGPDEHLDLGRKLLESRKGCGRHAEGTGYVGRLVSEVDQTSR